MRKVLLLTLLCCICGIACAQDRLSFRNLDVKSGISDNYVQSILRDKYGFMWFATLNGLDRYDGYQFKRYTTTQLGAYGNDVETVAEDAAGNIWIKGPVSYYIYNRELDKLDNQIQPVLNLYGIKGETGYLTVDKNQNLWCTVADTLFHYDFSQKELHRFSLSGKKKMIQVVCRETCAYILFADGEIANIDFNSCSILPETYRTLHPGLHYYLYIDTIGRLWFYASHAPGLQCYDTNRKQWIGYIGQHELTNDLITTVMDDGNGNLWIGTDNKGIHICHHQYKQLIWLNRNSGNPFSLVDNHINCFFKDNRNTMWVGTAKQGVSFTGLNNISFSIHPLPGQEDVKCLQEDKEGKLWLGFDGEGLALQDGKHASYTRYKMKTHALPSDLIICSCLDSKGRMWFGTYGGGAFHAQNGKFTRLSYPASNGQESPLKYIRRIAEDVNGTLWFGTFSQGVYAMNANGSFTDYTMNSSILRTGSIMDLAYSGGRNLYIGTSSGLYVMDVYTRKLHSINGNKAGTQTLSDSYITCLFYDSRGLLWIGTRTGVTVFDEQKDEMVPLTTEQGLSHPCIRSMVEDKYKNMWVTTDHGITNIVVTTPPSGHATQYLCYPYFEEDGIGSMNFNHHSITCTREGDVLIGGIGGYVQITPRPAGFYHPTEHPVVFTGLILANQRIEAGTPTPDGRILLPRNIQLMDEITMDYSDSNFSLEVSSMNFLNQHKQQFAYRLDEKEKWVKLEGNRIHFNRLSHGTFRLQVKVAEPDGYHRHPVSSLVIHVRPPFWLSAPAYCGYVILVLALLFFTFRNVQKKHQRLMQRQRHEMEIAQQHEMDEAKMRFFTNVSHDLRTPLALIITPLEKLLSTDLSRSLRADLELIHRNAVTLLNEVNQLLEFRKLDKQKTRLSLSYGSLSEFVRETCNSFHALSLKNGIKLELDLASPDLSMSFDRNKMQRILLNLLSNAVKYNRENGSIRVTVDRLSTAEGEQARIQIADSGIGIKDENKEKVFDRFFQEQHATTYVGSGIGLHIVKEYVTLHQGTIRVSDNQPEGSIFTITLPILDETAASTAPERLPATPVETNEEAPADVAAKEEEETSVLIVEDNNDFRHFLTECLKEHFKVSEASNGKEAIEILSKQSIQMVISDVMMPVMDGLELCHAVKTDIRFSHIPVILLTARTAEEHVLSGLREGADDYITKPFNLDILLIRIRKLLKWTRNNHERFKSVEVSPSEITISTLDEQLMEKAIRTVEQHMDNAEFSVEDLSAQVGISRSGLYKKLMSITGKSPLEFMRILRLKRGKQLLEQSQLSISQIAYQVGLSPKQFAKYFKEEFGSLPSEYKSRQNTTESTPPE